MCTCIFSTCCSCWFNPFILLPKVGLTDGIWNCSKHISLLILYSSIRSQKVVADHSECLTHVSLLSQSFNPLPKITCMVIGMFKTHFTVIVYQNQFVQSDESCTRKNSAHNPERPQGRITERHWLVCLILHSFFWYQWTVALVNQESEQNGGKNGEEEDDESTRNTIMFCNCNQKIVYNWNFLCEQEEFELSTSVCLSNSNKDF